MTPQPVSQVAQGPAARPSAPVVRAKVRRRRVGRPAGWLSLLLVTLLVGLAAPGRALAQKSARVEKLNAEAMSAYDDLEFDKAKRLLTQAINLSRGGGVPVTLQARTHLNLGIVYAAGLKDPTKGLEEFVKALRLDPEAKLDPQLKNPQLTELFMRARESLNLGGSELEQPVKLEHDPVETGTPGQPVTISVVVPPAVEVGRVEVYFRKAGRGEYNVSLLERRGARSFVGEIPGAAVTAEGVEYYIEARSVRGRVVARAASKQQPYKIGVVKAGGASLSGAPKVEGKPAELQFKRFALMLGLGTGFGYLFEDPAQNINKAGFALAPLHVAVELGVNLTDRWQISALGRIQVVSVTGLGELRLKRFFGDGNFRGNLHLGAGGGLINLRLPLMSATPGGMDMVEYIARGKGTAGLGGGFGYKFTPGIGLVFDLTVRFMFPDFAPDIDLTLGLEFYF